MHFQKYDLKGSEIGRSKANTSSVYKDLDLIHMNDAFDMGNRAKSILLSSLARDVQFLSSCNFMDYSLLVEKEFVYGSSSSTSSSALSPISTSGSRRTSSGENIHELLFTSMAGSVTE